MTDSGITSLEKAAFFLSNNLFCPQKSHALPRIFRLTGLYVFPLILFFLSANIALGATLQEANKLASSGDHAAAEAIYDSLLESNPDDLDARLRRGHVRSWQGRHQAAQADFQIILKSDSKHIDAAIGLAYSLAWSGKHRDAEVRFLEALLIDPSRLDAKKGFAFTALWRGDAEEAVQRFQKITQAAPDDPEAFVGLGQAFLLAGEPEKAKSTFQKALKIEPERADALEGIKATRPFSPKLELSAWLGHTSNGGDTGLRSLELAGWIKKDLRLWVRYDNALSLDNPALVREGREIPSIFLGALSNWGRVYTTRVEIGRRKPEDDSQYIFQGEQVVYLPSARSVKVGGLLAPQEDKGADWNIYTGYGIPLNSRLRIEPTFFYTKTGGLDENEWRILLPTEYRFPGGLQVGLHLAIGKLKSEVPQAGGNLWALSTLISMPLKHDRQGYLLIRYETPPRAEAFSVIALGLTFNLERKS